MRVDWCVSSWFRIKNTHSLTHCVSVCRSTSVSSSSVSPVRICEFFFESALLILETNAPC